MQTIARESSSDVAHDKSRDMQTPSKGKFVVSTEWSIDILSVYLQVLPTPSQAFWAGTACHGPGYEKE